MKVHTSDFKEQIKQFGRELDSKITYEIGNEEIELGKEELNSVSPHYEGAILKSVMKQIDIDSNVEIPIGTILRYQFGVKVSGEYEYIDYGNYVVYSIEKQEDTNSYKIVCYDKMLYAMKEYENSDITFPIAIKEYLEAICDKIGLEYEESPFANDDKIIANELFLDSEGKSMNYTFRDVLDQIAEASGGTICINKDDKLEIRYIHDVGEITDVSASSIEITDGEEAELQTFELEGKTEQKQTTPNKNLLYINSVSSGSGVTITRYSNSEIVITGTSTSSGTITIPLNSQQLSNQPYTVSAIVTGTINKEIYIDLNTTYNLNLEIDGSGTFTQTSATETASNIVTEMVLTFNNSTTFNNVHIKLQLEQSSTATSYIESQLLMPSPDYPSKLNSVGYENIINFADREYKITNYYYRDFGTSILITEDMVGKVVSFSYDVKISDYSGSQTTFVGVIGRSTNNSGMQSNIKTSGYLPMPNELTKIKIENIIIPNYVGQYLIIRPVGFSSPSTANIEVSNVQITYGETSLSYIPYGKYGIEIKTIGKNILLNTIKSATTYYGVTFTPVYNSDNMLEYITANGTATGNISASVNSRLYINKNTYYTLSGCPSGGTTSTYRFVCYLYDKNNTYLAGVSDLGNGATISNANVEYANLLMYISSGTTCNNLKFYPMLEKGTQATEYEPYKENIYSYQLDEPLRSIGDTKDLLYIKNGMLYVERKIGSVVLDGSESWSLNSTSGNQYRYWLSNDNFTTVFKDVMDGSDALGDFDNKIISNYFIYKRFNNTQIGSFSINNHGNALWFLINSDITSVNDFKTWLTTHNTEVQYILAEPYTEEIGQVQMPSVYDGITHIQTTDLLEPTMNVSYISEFEEIDEEYLKDVNVNFGEKYGAINTIVLSRGGDGDKISASIPADLPDEDKVAIQITDNQIMNGNDRNEYMASILNKLYGLEYYINDFMSTGICYLDLCDRYRIKIGDTSYKCVMFNDEANITQGLSESIYTDLPKEEQQEYKYMSSTDRGITQANIIAKKNEAEIVEYTQKLDDTNNRINAVETKQTETDRTINIISTNIDANGNITEVKTTTGFTFNAEGMTIEDSGSNFKALHRNDGTYYKEGDETVGQYTKDGSKQKDLALFGVYYYGMDDIDDTPMFVAQLYHDENGEEAFGHFYNRGD